MAGKKVEAKNRKLKGVKAKDDSERRVYTPDEIREILSIGKNSVYQLIQSNVFHSVKVGDHYRISKKSFDKWLEGAEMLSEGDDIDVKE